MNTNNRDEKASKRLRPDSFNTNSGQSPGQKPSRKKSASRKSNRNISPTKKSSHKRVDRPKSKGKYPPNWEIQRVEGIWNIESLDAPLPNQEDGEILTLGDCIPDPQDSASHSRWSALLGAFARTPMEEKIVELLVEGNNPSEIKDELGLKSESPVKTMIRRLRKITVDGVPLKEVLSQ